MLFRFLDWPNITSQLETMINHVGVLYKFHDKPITYLYNTLHYFERRVRDRPTLKRTLISKIVGAFNDIRPQGWCLSPQFKAYCEEDGAHWTPGFDYYVALVGRFAQTMQGKRVFPHMDFRFGEFSNIGAHALYVTCVEIIGLPVTNPAEVGAKLLDVVLEAYHVIGPQNLPDWINAVGLLLSNLPDVYSEGLTHRIISALSSPPLSQWTLPQTIFQVLDVNEIHVLYQGPTNNTSRLVHLLNLTHAVWHHSGLTQIQQLPELVHGKLEPLVKNEEQLLYVYHLVCPFSQRLHSERLMHPLFDLTRSLYRMLAKVNKETPLKRMDEICDVLYHIKYQFIGDSIKDDVEKSAKDFRPELQRRLKYIASGIFQQVREYEQEEMASASSAAKKPKLTLDF